MLPDELLSLIVRLYDLDNTYHACYSMSLEMFGSPSFALQERIIKPFGALQGVFGKTEASLVGTNIDASIAQHLLRSLSVRFIWLRRHAWQLYDEALIVERTGHHLSEQGDWRNAMIHYSQAGCLLARASILSILEAYNVLISPGSQSNNSFHRG